jgi:hypothetical protein
LLLPSLLWLEPSSIPSHSAVLIGGHCQMDFHIRYLMDRTPICEATFSGTRMAAMREAHEAISAGECEEVEIRAEGCDARPFTVPMRKAGR